jgi:DNA-binding NarL/FixJ family response regulator
LTPREREVAALIGRGLSNGEIADALFVGKRAIETHIGSIYGKLGYTARTQIALWAAEALLAADRPAVAGSEGGPAPRPDG